MDIRVLPTNLVRLADDYRNNSRFPFAANHFVNRYLENFKGNFILNHLTSSELTYMIAAYLFYLHYWRDKDDPTSGATQSRLQTFCNEHGLAGPRKVTGLLGVAEAAGYITRVTADTDARVRILRPTSKAYTVLTGVIGSHVEAIEILEQTGEFKKYINTSPEAPLAISAHSFGLLYLSGIKLIDAMEELKPYMAMDNALKIIFSAYVNRNANLIHNSSIGVISKRFGISRTQVQRVLEKAQENNQLKILSRGGRQVQLMPSMIEYIDTYVSLFLAQKALGARSAMAFYPNT